MTDLQMCWNTKSTLCAKINVLFLHNFKNYLSLVCTFFGLPAVFAVTTAASSWYSVLLFGMRDWTLNDWKKRKSTLVKACVTTLEIWNLQESWGEKVWDPLWRQPARTIFQRLHYASRKRNAKNKFLKKDKEKIVYLDITPLTWLCFLRTITQWTCCIAAAGCHRTVSNQRRCSEHQAWSKQYRNWLLEMLQLNRNTHHLFCNISITGSTNRTQITYIVKRNMQLLML